MCTLGDKGRALFARAHDDYDATYTPHSAQTSASGCILWRKDTLVLDGGFKWMNCVWRIEGNALVLEPHESSSGALGRFFLTSETQFTKPKRKRYPLQFGTEPVYHSQLLETVTYGATGYARSPLDPLASIGTTETRTFAKVGALDVGELEKLLLCVQAVSQGFPATHYFGTYKTA